jgi:Glycosyl hydrolase catalytic core
MTEQEELELEAFDVSRDLQDVDVVVGGMPPEKLTGKKGIGFTLRDSGEPGSWEDNLPKVLALDVDWNYSWGPTRPLAQPESIEFLPMIWGYWNDPEALQEKLEYIKSNQSPKMILGYNEPDKPDQANMKLETALSSWPLLEACNVPLVSPSCAYPLGEWMTAFMDRAAELNLRMDAVGVHYYGSPNARAFIGLMRTIYAQYGRPILVTEFAVGDWQADTPAENRYSPEAVLDFLKEVLPWMEEQDYILGYAWFPFNIDDPVGTSSAMILPSGNLTALGQFYKGFQGEEAMPSSKPTGAPSGVPSDAPSDVPSTVPTNAPSGAPKGKRPLRTKKAKPE